MAIRKRASAGNIDTLREDQTLRIILQEGLRGAERDIKIANEFGDLSEKVNRLYDRKAYIEKLLAADAKLSVVLT
jgi:hypothetical protein